MDIIFTKCCGVIVPEDLEVARTRKTVSYLKVLPFAGAREKLEMLLPGGVPGRSGAWTCNGWFKAISRKWGTTAPAGLNEPRGRPHRRATITIVNVVRVRAGRVRSPYFEVTQ